MFTSFNWLYLAYFALSMGLALVVTPLAIKFGTWIDLMDRPISPRKIHKVPMPLVGGFVVFISFFAAMGIYLLSGNVNFFFVPPKFFFAIILGALVLMVGGFLDDKYDLPAKLKFIYPSIASLIIVLFGIGVGIKQISNPFGAPISLDFLVIGIPASGIFIWLWMMGMTFTTKLLDGLDGLSAGIGLIGSVTIFFLSLTPKVNQPITATLAIILAGSLLGYLWYSFHPAKLFLGEGGSLLIGFVLGALSVLSGAKIATALLVMGVPILDVAWVIARRLWYGVSPFQADRKHLHFRLLDVGLSHRQSVLVLYALSGVFGFTAVFLQSWGKLIALIVLFICMILLALGLVFLYKRRQSQQKDTID